MNETITLLLSKDKLMKSIIFCTLFWFATASIAESWEDEANRAFRAFDMTLTKLEEALADKEDYYNNNLTGLFQRFSDQPLAIERRITAQIATYQALPSNEQEDIWAIFQSLMLEKGWLTGQIIVPIRKGVEFGRALQNLEHTITNNEQIQNDFFALNEEDRNLIRGALLGFMLTQDWLKKGALGLTVLSDE